MARSKKPKARATIGPPYHITLYGGIHPPASKITITNPPEGKFATNDGAQTIKFKVYVKESRVRVECELANLIDGYVPHTLIAAGDAARAMIDLVAFNKGLGLAVIFDKWKDWTGKLSPIIYFDPLLSTYATSFTENRNLAEMMKIVIEEPDLAMALNDLIVANTMPHQVPANCGQAVEGLRHIIAGKGMDAKQAWPIMREILNVDKSFLDIIINSAMHYRHGHRVRIEGPETQLILHRSWQIMDRYFHLKLRNLVRLAEPEFPLLKG